MLLTVGTFRSRVASGIDVFLGELVGTLGRPVGKSELKAWRSSFPKLSTVLSTPALQGVHMYFGDEGDLSLEYQLPAANNWCDVVLLGQRNKKPCALVIELKDWMTRGDHPGRAEGLVERSGVQELHPSDQVRGYAEYCRRFHSAIAAHGASVAGCVLLVGDYVTEPYTAEPNARLTTEYPIFTMAANDANVRFPEFVTSMLVEPAPDFAQAFESGRYRQDRGFLAQIGRQILNPKNSYFELLDDQRRAFALCKATALEAVRLVKSGKTKRQLVIVKGPPGSGKSAVAARLWASLVTESDVPDGSVVFTTTSASQSTNWESLFNEAAGIAVGRGIVRGANSYFPISTHRLGRLRGAHGEDFLSDPNRWEDNLKALVGLGEAPGDGARDCENLVTIVDEAHALINPERVEGRGQFGFAPTLGPQAYHILRCSVVTFMFLDPEQSFRDRENTTTDEMRKWATDLRIDVVDLDLSGVQFRCGGSAEYVEWLEGVLKGSPASVNRVRASAWCTKAISQIGGEQKAAQPPGDYSNAKTHAPANAPNFRGRFEFRLVESPEVMEHDLRSRLAEGKSVRLASSFSRKWVTRDRPAPHALPAELWDFNISYESGSGSRTWSKIWNFAPNGDYTLFVQAPVGSQMHRDPLSEVGCPYVIRGFDYDYLGLIWLDDFVWRGNGWTVNLSALHETGLTQLASRARREQMNGVSTGALKELGRKVAQAYRILLTRALEGTYVWISDQETREHIRESLVH